MKIFIPAVLSLFTIVRCTVPNAKKIVPDKRINLIPIRSNLKYPKIEDVKRLAWYSAASVCNDTSLQNWDCASCKKVPLGTTKFIGSVENKLVGTKSYIAAVEETKELLVAFRGGVNFQNGAEYLNGLQVNFKPVINDFKVTVHAGIRTAMESVIKEIGSKLATLLNDGKYKNYKIVVVGHSLGAGIACLGLLRLQYDLKLSWKRMSLYTYGQIRTGNIPFAKYFNSLPIVVSRGVNYADLAPHTFPIGLINPIAHIHNEVWIDNANGTSYKFCNNKILEDPDCSNSIPIIKRTTNDHLKFFETTWDEKLTC